MKPVLSSWRGLRMTQAAGVAVGVPSLSHLGFHLESETDWSPCVGAPPSKGKVEAPGDT